MNFYSFEEIKQAGSCVAFIEAVMGLPIQGGRCQAVWRGGDGFNVAVSDHEWYDHKAKVGGGLIDLCVTAKFPGDMQAAQQFLGEWLKLKPKMTKGHAPGGTGRYEELISQGYVEVKRYKYCNEAGELVHFVARLEHPTKGKEFLQGNPKGWGLRGVTPILYRLTDWVHASFVCVVEGEKDADTLIDELEIPATTNCGGAEKWRPEYAGLFRGKNVVIVRDNDEPGQKHADVVARHLKGLCQRLVVVCPSTQPKGDVTDWVRNEGGSKEALIDIIRKSPLVDQSALEDVDPLVDAAKTANKSDFANYTEHKETLPNGSAKLVKTPRQINAIIEDVHRRFVGFPRKVGGSRFMFDHDRESGHIVYLHNSSELFAWIGRKSKRRINWAIGDSMVTKSEIFMGLAAEAQTYEAIANVPDWPTRADVYYAHPKLPDPSPGFQFFHDFVAFFNPANDTYRTFLKAFIAAPLWYVHGIPRPGWIIDSSDGAGVGKTTLVELVSRLYRSAPIRTNKQELRTNVAEIIKRLVSTEGRLARVFLADNITGDFHCSELSDFMTSESISGKAPYGRGEETRPNNLTYVITANSATVDNDLSDRCYFVQLKKATRSSKWKRDVLEYIEKFRMNIIADIIGMLESRDPLDSPPQTRFPEFEEIILRGVCQDPEEYDVAMETLMDARASANIEDEHARLIEDEFMARLIDAERYPGSEYIFIRSEVAKLWLDEILGDERRGNNMQYLRNLVKNGLCRRFDVQPEIYPNNGNQRRRGIMWRPREHNGGSPRVLGMKNRKVVEII